MGWVFLALPLFLNAARIESIYALYIDAIHTTLVILGLVYFLFLILFKGINLEIHYTLQGLYARKSKEV